MHKAAPLRVYCPTEWVAVKEDGKYRGEIYLELTWYPRENPDVSEHWFCLLYCAQDLTVRRLQYQYTHDSNLQRHASRLDPATRLSRLPAGTNTVSTAAKESPGIEFIPRDRSKDLEFTEPSCGTRPPVLPPKDQVETTFDSGRLPLPGESDEAALPPTPTPTFHLSAVNTFAPASTSLPLPSPAVSYQRRPSAPTHVPPPTASPEPIATLAPPPPTGSGIQGSVSLPPRPTTRTPVPPSGPPVPPRPTSAAPGLQPSPRSDPLINTVHTPAYPSRTCLTPPAGDAVRRSPSPSLPPHPDFGRPLPAAPAGAAQPPLSPLEAKRREARDANLSCRDEPAPPAYSPSPGRQAPSFADAFPNAAPPDVEARARRSRELLQRRREDEERERLAAETRRRSAEEARRHQIEAEKLAAEERKRQAEQKRLEAIQASQRAREERIRQEQEDARIAAAMAEEAEAAERENLAQRRAEDEALAKKMLAEEEAERARQQLERQRIDEDFVRQLREEDQQREDDERRAREEADAAFARSMREEEEAETRRRIEEDERIARSLAERERQPPVPAVPPSVSSVRPR